MSIVKSNKNRDLFPSVFSDFFDTDKFFGPRWLEKGFANSVPSVNIKENGKEFNIELAAPGYKKDNLRINVENDVLTISAEKQAEKKEDSERFTRKEFSYNSFSRSFTLPQSVLADKIDAKYDNGILRLCIPKKEEAKTLAKKEIKVA